MKEKEALREAGGPLVSVIIPCYKQGHFLAGAIDSILGQTYPRVEVIVVDDGSPDDTPAVAARYGDRIRYIRKENAGISAARNTGILAARGEFILFLDSDDYLRPETLARHLAAADAHPTGTVFHGAYQFVDAAGRQFKQYESQPLVPDAFHALLTTCQFPPNALLIRRSAFANAGLFDVSLRCSEDWDMWIRLAAAGYQFVSVPDAMAVYRCYPGSVSRNSERVWRTGLAVLQRSRAYHGHCALCDRQIARGIRTLREWCFDLIIKELQASRQRGELRAGLLCAAQAAMKSPRFAGYLMKEAGALLLQRAARSSRELPSESPQVS
jgi:glycosyltransferase involved in cell wall biosynthesis